MQRSFVFCGLIQIQPENGADAAINVIADVAHGVDAAVAHHASHMPLGHAGVAQTPPASRFAFCRLGIVLRIDHPVIQNIVGGRGAAGDIGREILRRLPDAEDENLILCGSTATGAVVQIVGSGDGGIGDLALLLRGEGGVQEGAVQPGAQLAGCPGSILVGLMVGLCVQNVLADQSLTAPR